jgi:superfamily II DNA or RNA helicase
MLEFTDYRLVSEIDGNQVRQYYQDTSEAVLEPAGVLKSLKDNFHFKEDNAAEGAPGLRRPQIGALHAVLSNWTLNDGNLATVVMPTGTGKTETMLAVFASQRPKRVLVLVPSDALRDQIGSKFETLGKLPELGIVDEEVARPAVGKVKHGFTNPLAARGFAEACNIIVSTPQALMESDEETRAALLAECTHLFVDEAHHLGATTWKQIRDSFTDKPVVQFTATPYRTDGQKIGGEIIYNFPLRQAQREGYFSEIDYIPVTSFDDANREIATKAVEILNRDLGNAKDHLVMARTKTIKKAQDIHRLYQEVAAEHNPVIIYSSQKTSVKTAALAAIKDRSSRIIVCVDMLGEGFDLPELKIAAIHDTHKSLGVTLQFIGRFARVAGENIGKATAIVNRIDQQYDQRLKDLYDEDSDWNHIIQELSSSAITEQQELREFEQSFANAPEGVSLKNLAPKMSTVVYKTQTTSWHPDQLSKHYEKNLYTKPIAVNNDKHVLWFVTKETRPVGWGDIKSLEDTTYALFIYYWDKQNNLLYINSSSNDGAYEEQAKLLCGESVERYRGIDIFRTMATLNRRVPTNVGMLDILNRGNRFQMNVGANVSEGFTPAARRNKSQTNIFAYGFDHESGLRVSVGASVKGRIWSHKAAFSIKHWMTWCDDIGKKLKDDSIDAESVLSGFIIPKPIQTHPGLIPLTLEWPTDAYLSGNEHLEVVIGGDHYPLIDCELKIKQFDANNPMEFSVCTPTAEAGYKLTMSRGKMSFASVSSGALLRNSRSSAPLGDFLNKEGLRVLFEKQTIVEPDMIMLQPNSDIPPYDLSNLIVIDWAGIDLTKESQGAERDQATIQARAISHLLAQDWDIILDDDGSGETADIVAFKSISNTLKIAFIHCKYSLEPSPGARIGDLYEVCGQTQKSTARTRKPQKLIANLIRREVNRRKNGRNNLIKGSPEELYQLSEKADRMHTEFEFTIVQPGISKRSVSGPQLELIAATSSYVSDTSGGSRLMVICSD